MVYCQNTFKDIGKCCLADKTVGDEELKLLKHFNNFIYEHQDNGLKQNIKELFKHNLKQVFIEKKTFIETFDDNAKNKQRIAILDEFGNPQKKLHRFHMRDWRTLNEKSLLIVLEKINFNQHDIAVKPCILISTSGRFGKET